MSGLLSSRNTPEWSGSTRHHVGLLPVEASTSLFVGGLCAINANGRAVPAQVRAASPLDRLRIAGVVEYVYAGGIMPPGIDALNQTGNGGLYPSATGTLGAAGAISVGVVTGIFGYDYDTTITAANIGELMFASDDHTMTLGTLTAYTTTITTPNAAPVINVLKPDIVPGTFQANSAANGTGTAYIEGASYSVDYTAGLFVTIGTTIGTAATVYVTYRSAVGLVPAGRLVSFESGQAYVDLRDKSVAM